MAQSQAISPPLWTVVGEGSIGLLAAGRLSLASYPVHLIRRQPQPLSFRLQTADTEYSFILPAAQSNALHYVFIPVKAYDTVAVIQQLLPLLSDDAQVVLSHNGMGTIEQILPLLHAEQGLWFLSTSHGAFKPDATTVLHTGIGQSVLGALNQAALLKQSEVEQAMQAALGPVTLLDDIRPALWQKLAVNAVINPLTALHQCKNGALRQPKYAAAIHVMIEEFVLIAKASGQEFSPADIGHRVALVIEQTAENYSSMQQDFAKGRRSELEYITGFLLKQAKLFQLDLPAHQAMYQLLLQKSPR